MYANTFLVLSLALYGLTTAVRDLPSCRQVNHYDGTQRSVCEFSLVIQDSFLMTKGTDRVIPDCTAPDGTRLKTCKACKVNTDCAGTEEEISFDDVITADGIWRPVLTFNGTIPGPKIEVVEGAQVVVHVTNRVLDETFTVHWHGFLQLATPWMDGVPMITQCPIEHGQTFTYRFRADIPGTFWYHAHSTARSEGLAGALIVYRREELIKPILADVDETAIVMQDWFHQDITEINNAVILGGITGVFWPENQAFPNGTKDFNPFIDVKDSADQILGVSIFTSFLFDGRGRFAEASDNVPLKTYVVKRAYPALKYKFRLIGAQAEYSFRFSIDGHWLTVVSTDSSCQLKPTRVQSIIIHAGERYDVVIEATGHLDAYWMRADLLLWDAKTGKSAGKGGRAILIYQNEYSKEVPEVDERSIMSHPIPCMPYAPCPVLNCPFENFPPSENTKCMKVSELKRSATLKPYLSNLEWVKSDRQLFFNFGFGTFGPGINGRALARPTSPPLTQPNLKSSSIVDCPDDCSSPKNPGGCKCTNMVDLTYGEPYQFVFTNHGFRAEKNGGVHPVHLHGHKFEVVKMGYATYDENGQYKAPNTDICCPCPDDPSVCCTVIDDSNRNLTTSTGGLVPCRNHRWTNPEWNTNPDAIPGLNLDNPVEKDNVIVTPGGYTVIRFRADNPGLWFMHCHTDQHSAFGMGLLLNEGEPFQSMKQVPQGFPKCNNFDWSSSQYDWAQMALKSLPPIQYKSKPKPRYPAWGGRKSYKWGNRFY